MRESPFRVLGIQPTADRDAVRAAYRQKARACHPDQFVGDPGKQAEAQQQLLELNLAYEEALKLAGEKRVGFNCVSAEEAKHFAQRLYSQGNYGSALRQLHRADVKDADWFALEGRILMALKQFDSAHRSYREAVKRDPDNRAYRQGALDAALAIKKSKTIGYKVQTFFESLFPNPPK